MVLATITRRTVRPAVMSDPASLSAYDAPTLADVPLLSSCPTCGCPLVLRPTRASPDRLVCTGERHEWSLGVATERGTGGSAGYPLRADESSPLAAL